MKYVLVIAFAICSIYVSGQENIEVSTDASYANEVYYSLENGTIASSPRNNWELAFTTNRFDVNILANHAAGVEIYTYPLGTIADWDNVDIGNISNWNEQFNSIVDLDNGAFLVQTNPNDPFDFGWGKYNPASHVITGDSLYVVKTVEGIFKKLWIVQRNPNIGFNNWELKYANIDGSEEQVVTLNGEEHTSKNFFHFSMQTNEIVYKEPETSAWDLLFTKYHDYTIPYDVTGVTINARRIVAHQVDDVDQESYKDYDETLFNDSLIVIGSNWKSFTGMGYAVDADRVYFIKSYDLDPVDSSYWKIYFTAFGGSATGNYNFVQEKLGTSSFDELEREIFFEIYPNPVVNGQMFILLDVAEPGQVIISDLTGSVKKELYWQRTGFEKQRIDLTNLNKGIYTISFLSESGIASRKFVIE